MNKNDFNTPLQLNDIKITDTFWKSKMELVRTNVIPFQWNALNDQIEDAAPSFCMHNFKAAAKMNQEKRLQGSDFPEPAYTFRGFECLPEDPAHLDDTFYGFVFQDSDFYKWVEAVSYSLTQHPDPMLEKLADDAIDIVCNAQQEDGYLDTYYILNGKDQIFTNLRDHHELYCLGHLIEAAVAYYQATGKDKLLQASCRFADYATAYFGQEEGKCKGYPGHEIVEMALIRLYELTGTEKYLHLARHFVDERGKQPYYFDKEQKETTVRDSNELRYEYYQAHLPVRKQEEAVGHAVRAVYLYSGMTDIARLTQEKALYASCETLWSNMENQKMYITGGIGGTHIGEAFSFHYDLPNDTAYAETCASIGLVFWARRMLQIHADAKYANLMERALYNTVLAGMALDGKSFFYTNPLEVLPEACDKDERKSHIKATRQKWFGCACCPPNLARLISSVSTYAYTENKDTLFVHLYMGSEITKRVNGKTIKITISSELPWNGKVQIQINTDTLPMTIALRIPDWCPSYTLKGVDPEETRLKDGYLYISKTWTNNSCLTLDFAMDVQIFQANTSVREDIGKLAVLRGPLVYCLEEVDNGKNLHLLTLDSSADATIEDFQIGDESITAICISGYRQELSQNPNKLYFPATKDKKVPQTLRLIPYYTWANRGENEMSVWIRQST